MTSADLLLLSSSRVHGGAYLDYAHTAVADLLGTRRTVTFIPFAVADQPGYTASVRAAFADFGADVIGLDGLDAAAAAAAIATADVVFVGGGNSFRLLKRLHELDLVAPIHARVSAGELRYLGVSAGSNMACPSLRTTNDMPIVQPPTFQACDLVPLQINPHYLDAEAVPLHMGETREQRIAEFLEENDVPVVGLREGAWLRRHGERLDLGGVVGARLFRRGYAPLELQPGSDLSWLLALEPRFDQPQ